jgi:hypothetical protein
MVVELFVVGCGMVVVFLVVGCVVVVVLLVGCGTVIVFLVILTYLFIFQGCYYTSNSSVAIYSTTRKTYNTVV